jgi:hypothetical protein
MAVDPFWLRRAGRSGRLGLMLRPENGVFGNNNYAGVGEHIGVPVCLGLRRGPLANPNYREPTLVRQLPSRKVVPRVSRTFRGTARHGRRLPQFDVRKS